jgi:hypothetical protein
VSTRNFLARLILLAGLALAPAGSLASEIEGRCPTDSQRLVFREFQDRLSSADSTEEAQELALSKVRLGHKAVRQASKLVSDQDGIDRAEARLVELEEGILASQTPIEVASQFERLDAQALNCHYDTVEVVVIVIGFVLGILPGILFLVLFC